MPTVLIIDDDVPICRLVGTILTLDGFQVFGAHSADKGLDLARELNPDVILMDIRLPGMDGYEAIRTLKADDQLKDIPVIAVTAQGDSEQAFAAGCADFMQKPFSPAQLRNAVGQLIEVAVNT